MTGLLRPVRSAVAVVVTGALLLVLAIAQGRPDGAAIGGVILLTAILARSRRGISRVELAERRPGAGGPSEDGGGHEAHQATLRVIGTGPVRVRLSTRGHRERHALLAPGDYDVALTSARTGVLPPLRVDWLPLAEDGALEGAPQTFTGPEVLVLPSHHPSDDLPLPSQLMGLTGPHTSRRRGDGDDLHDIAPFAPGDRLRSVDWHATARLGTRDSRLGTQLFVRRRLATAEAVVAVVLDSRDDVGVEVRTWAGGQAVSPLEPTSLDLARQAAVSVARTALLRGDRVGFSDLAGNRAPVRPGAGIRHLRRLEQAIARSAPIGTPAPLRRPPQVTAGALVVVVSTFLDDVARDAALAWSERGHPVLCLDVLPPAELAGATPGLVLAFRVLMLERGQRLADLTRVGITVTPWAATLAAGSAGRVRRRRPVRRPSGRPAPMGSS